MIATFAQNSNNGRRLIECALSLSIHGCKSPRILTPDVERVLVPYAGNDVTAA